MGIGLVARLCMIPCTCTSKSGTIHKGFGVDIISNMEDGMRVLLSIVRR